MLKNYSWRLFDKSRSNSKRRPSPAVWEWAPIGRCIINPHPHITTSNRYSVPGLFMPKTFRSQERTVPMGNFHSWDFVPESFHSLGTKVPGRTKVPGNETFVPGNFRSRGTKVPGPFVPRNFRSQDFSFPGSFVPPTILQGIGYERRQL